MSPGYSSEKGTSSAQPPSLLATATTSTLSAACLKVLARYSHEGQTSETQTGTKSQPMLNMSINKFTDGGNYVHDAETIWLE